MSNNLHSYNTPYGDKFLHLKLNVYAKLIYPRLSYRMRMSLQKGTAYYYKKDGYFYIVYSVSDLCSFFNLTPYKVRIGLNALNDVGLIRKHWAGHFYRFELPKFAKYDTSKLKVLTPPSKKFSHSHRELTRRTNRHYSNTVNTPSRKSQSKFKPASMIEMWENSVQKMGLTADTIDQIASFSSTYGQNAYKITGLIKEARDIIANHYHVTRKARRFENNQNVIDKLAKKLRKLFTYITTKGFEKAKLSNYAGFLVNSLKRFFKWAMCNKRDETVKPKTDNRHFRGYRKRKPIKEGKPQWMKDEEAGKNPKTKKTDKSLTRLIQARQSYDEAVMRVSDPIKPNPDHKKLVTLKKRVKHYEKLYNAKRKRAKPAPKPEQHKQAKKLPRTDPALQREIQDRLRRLGEV